MRTLKRLLGLLGLGAVGYTVYKRTAGRSNSTPTGTGTARWTPLTPASSSAPPVVHDGGWVEPSDGQCPDSHPVKANADSGIYHVPGGASYVTTRAERCYCTAEDATADGFRAAKR